MTGCVLVAICVIAFWPGEAQPEHEGKKLSQWLTLQYARPQDATKAVRAIGTNGLPFLIKRMEYEFPAWRINLLRAVKKLPDWTQNAWINGHVIFPTDVWNRSAEALFAFRLLGTEASPAVPELARLMHDKPENFRAANALAYIGGRNAVVALLMAMKDKVTSDNRRMLIMSAMQHLSYNGAELTEATPAFIEYLQSTNQYVASLAAFTLGHFKLEPQLSVPELSNAVLSLNFRVRRNSIQALGEFGSAAMPAIDVVSNALFDSDSHIRDVATNAVLRIAPQMLGTNEIEVKWVK